MTNINWDYCHEPKCPICGDTDFRESSSGEREDNNENTIWEDRHCDKCGTDWIEEYTLTDYHILIEEGKK
ncbi:MAG TPA: hypothetical protein EYQ57_07555 [Methylococcaceae bacterium]|jgi:transcriptional regulator NrdR family protein|nr:hypothetical protein [Methylococcaceae bacterium]